MRRLGFGIHYERPLAWAQLSHQKVRFAVAMGGIAFANVLIFMQLGFRALFTEGATLVADHLRGDLFLVSSKADYLGAGNFDRIRLYQAAAVEGVTTVTPVYIDYGSWSYQDFTTFGAQVIAFNPNQSVFNLPEVNQQLAQLSLPNALLVDRLSKPTDFGPIPQQFAQQGAVKALINNHRVTVVGLFGLGSSFFRSDGNIIMSETSYRSLFGSNALEQVSVGIVTLQPGTNLEAIRAGIKAHTPGVEVLTHAELVARELNFQQENPAGIIFTFGAVIGFIVGVVLVYQVLYADVSDHLPEYATLKAMGYSDRSLLGVIFQEAMILAVLGFIPGYITSFGMYNLLASLTRLELVMRPDIAIAVFLLTLVMCTISAAIASNKLRSADPADVFS